MGLVWATCKSNVLGTESDEEDDEDYDKLSDSSKSAPSVRGSRLERFSSKWLFFTIFTVKRLCWSLLSCRPEDLQLY